MDDFDSFFQRFLEETLHHKVLKLSSGTGSPGLCRKRAVKRLWWWWWWFLQEKKRFFQARCTAYHCIRR